jgi:predicted dinucleotide-binding enzyme
MKIGIIGTGSMGLALGVRWAGVGHEVMFGSRDLAKAQAAARRASASALSGDFDAAAAFGEVILYTVRGIRPSQVLRDPRTLAGKVVIDCNNSDADPRRPGEFDPAPVPSYPEQLARDVPAARVVQAFNTVPQRVIELPRAQLAPRRISVFVCSDDAAARATAIQLANELGFVGVDCGELERARIVDGVVNLIRFHIAKLGSGPLTTISLGNAGDGAAP